METIRIKVWCEAVSDDVVDVIVDYCYEPASGDGWHEPRCPEELEICEVRFGYVDIQGRPKVIKMDQFTAEELITLETDILETRSIDAAERKADKDAHERESLEEQLRRQ